MLCVLACCSIDRTLPFELRALEAALAHTCRSLEQESIQVERATLPSLKALMQKVNHPLCLYSSIGTSGIAACVAAMPIMITPCPPSKPQAEVKLPSCNTAILTRSYAVCPKTVLNALLGVALAHPQGSCAETKLLCTA